MTLELSPAEALEKACISSAKLSTWGRRKGLVVTKNELILKICKLLGTSEIDVSSLKISELNSLLSTLGTNPQFKKVLIPNSRLRKPYLDVLEPLLKISLAKVPVPSLKLLTEKLLD